MSTVLGADLGGTWLRACLFKPGKARPRSVKRPTVAPMNLAVALREIKRALGCSKLQRLTVGSAGIWSPREKAALKRSLKGLAAKIEVMSDVELAHRAALGGGVGILVIAGTGSIALGVDGNGKARRAGGLGPLLGDEGSAYWVGKTALDDARIQRALPKPSSLARAPRPRHAVAALAPKVFALAARSPAAAALRRRAARHIAALAAQAAKGLSFSGEIPVAWHGGLFKDRLFLEDFLSALRREDARFKPRPPLFKPEAAAALLF